MRSHPRGLAIAKLAVYLVDYLVGYLVTVRPELVRGRLVLYDRYFDDLLVDPRRYRYSGPRWLAGLVQRVIPRPDLFVILDAPVDQILQRKPERSAAELERLRLGYQRLATSLPHATVVDATQPAPEVARRVAAHILSTAQRRYTSSPFPPPRRDIRDLP